MPQRQGVIASRGPPGYRPRPRRTGPGKKLAPPRLDRERADGTLSPVRAAAYRAPQGSGRPTREPPDTRRATPPDRRFAARRLPKMRWTFTSVPGGEHQPVAFGLVPEDGRPARRAGVAGQIAIRCSEHAGAIAFARQFHDHLNLRLIPVVLLGGLRRQGPRLILAGLRRRGCAPLL